MENLPKKRRTAKEAPIKNILKQCLDIYHLDVPVSEQTIKNAWKEITGEAISKLTDNIYVKDHVLYVTLSIAALKHEISMRRTSLQQQINDYVGYEAVKHIVVR